MADKYCSTCFKTGEELDEALQAALGCGGNAERAEKAARDAEEAVRQGQEIAANAVLFTPQTLTDEQKAQARENVGAASAEEVSQALQEANTAFESMGTAIMGLGSQMEQLTRDTAEHDRMIDNLDREVADLAKATVSVDLSQFESDGIITETYADGSTLTYTMEFDANGNPIKITDSNGNITVLTW